MGCPLSKIEVEEATQSIYKNDAERATFERAFSRQPLSSFSAAQRDECFINSVSYRFAADSSVCTKGEVLDLAGGAGFLVLMRGSICVEESQGLIKRLEGGDVVGLEECLHGVPPLRTMKAKTSAVMRLIKKEDVEKAIKANSASVARMGTIFNVLKATPVFLGLSDLELLSLQEHLFLKTFMAGESIIERGDRGDEMFILVEGSAVVSDVQARDSPTGPVLRATDSTKSVILCFPNYFGEGALLVDEEAGAPAYQKVMREKTRTASVSAGPGGCSVLVVPQHAFDLHLRKLRHRFHRNIYSRDELVPSSSPLPHVTPLLSSVDRPGVGDRPPHRALLPSEVKARGLWRVDQKDVLRRHATRAEKDEANDDGGSLWLSNLLCGAGLR